MKRILFVAAVATLFVSVSGAQETKGTIKGSVVDSLTGERIAYASVLVSGTTTGTVANDAGYFILRNVDFRGLKLIVSAVGYRERLFNVEAAARKGEAVELDISPAPKTLETVTVTGESFNGSAGVAGTNVITTGELQKNVGVFKNDVVQYITQLPGVVTVSGVSSQYFVRGGGVDENLVMIDGMQVYNLSHAFGLFSFVDPLIVKVANFSAGGFGAQYGGRLSSVFDIQTIDGDNRNYKAAGTLDLLSSDFELTGPISRGNSSFLFFYRRPLYQSVLNKFYSLGLPFDFYDGFAKLTANVAGTGHISVEFLTSADRIKSNDLTQPDFTWGNSSGGVTGNYLFGDQFNAKFGLTYSVYKAEQLPNNSTVLYHQLSQISNPSMFANVTSYTESQNELSFGFLFNFPNYSYTFTNTYGFPIVQSESQVEPQVWTSYDIKIGERLSLGIGLRSDLRRTFGVISGGQGYLTEPRVSIAYNPSDIMTLYVAYGIYHQRLIDLNDENLVFTPFELVAPVPDSMRDEQSSQYVIGTELDPNVLTTVRVEAYYKSLSQLLGVNRDKVYSWESDFITGRGEAYGLEISAGYETERYYLQGSYSFGRTTRTFEGVTYYPRYDLRHQMNLTAGWQAYGNLWLRAKWKIASGLPYTPIAGFYGLMQFDPYNLPAYAEQPLYNQALFGNLNTARLPGFQSLDLSGSYELYFDWAHLTLQGTLINVYNRRNVFYINNVTGDVVYQLPTLFDFSLGWNF